MSSCDDGRYVLLLFELGNDTVQPARGWADTPLCVIRTENAGWNGHSDATPSSG